MTGLERWQEIGDGVLVRRHHHLDLNVGLVVGAERCLVIDTRSTWRQGEQLRTAVRTVTELPWTVVNTHAHYDHCFGNAAFVPAAMWGHPRVAEILAAEGETQRAELSQLAHAKGEHELAADLARTPIVPPDHGVTACVDLDLGGRRVRLSHLGRGHTDNDLVVEVEDAAVLFAGDLVEQGAPPAFEDAFPLDWPITLDRLLALPVERIVPGHGAVVDPAFVQEQAALIDAVALVAIEAHPTGRGIDELVTDAALALPSEVARTALQRAYRQLGDLARGTRG